MKNLIYHQLEVVLKKYNLPEHFHRTMSEFKTLFFVSESFILHHFVNAFSPWVDPGDKPSIPQEKEFIFEDIHRLRGMDLKLFTDGLCPYSLLKPESPLTHSKRFTQILWAGLRMARQRKLNQTQLETQDNSLERLGKENVPDYYQRNFHWQLGGYLSDESAELYEHQVDILFRGTTDAMRRLVIRPLAEFIAEKKLEHAHVLEVAAGTGAGSKQVLASFPKIQLTLSDLSYPYLKKAQKDLNDYHFNTLQAAAEKLPLAEASFDATYSIFLFHEIPSKTRMEVLKEAYRILKPGGLFIMVDSIQKGDEPRYDSSLLDFPKNFHEPFYKHYTEWNITDHLTQAGFTHINQQRGLFSKVVWARKSDESAH